MQVTSKFMVSSWKINYAIIAGFKVSAPDCYVYCYSGQTPTFTLALGKLKEKSIN